MRMGRAAASLVLAALLLVGGYWHHRSRTRTSKSLVEAARLGHWSAVKRCLARGDDIGQVDAKGWTALHRAARRGDRRMVALLLHHQARVDARTNSQLTALHLGVRSEAVVRLLLDHGADVTAVDGLGQPALMSAVVMGTPATVRLLLDFGSPTAQDALRYAAMGRSAEIVDVLASHGADVNAVGEGGLTPLHYAAWRGGVRVVEALLERGARIKVADVSGSTPLHLAADEDDRLAVIERLLAAGADPRMADRNGDTPLHLAARRWHGSRKTMASLVKAGAPVNAHGLASMTALHSVCVVGDTVAAELLIDAGADPAAVDEQGETPLFRAQTAPICELLLRRGGSVGTRALDGSTALHSAAADGLTEVVAALLRHGADATAQDANGRTAAGRAASDPRLRRLLGAAP